MSSDASEDVERQFLEAIASNPNDAETRAVYADWLEERGDPRGEYLRLEAQLYTIPLRLDDLEKRIGSVWLELVSRIYDVRLGNPGRNKISVIKAIREITGLGLKDSKDIVDGASDETPYTLRKQVTRKEADALAARFAATGAMVQIVGFAGQRVLAVSPPTAPTRSVVLLSVVPERKLDAIKLVRELTGYGLKDAKDLVERVQRGNRVTILRNLSLPQAGALVTRFGGIGDLVTE